MKQARGETALAVASYQAGSGTEHLAAECLLTAQGFAKRGDLRRAWREAALAKFMDSRYPEVHSWMAQRLLEEGYYEEGQIQSRIGQLLQGEH